MSNADPSAQKESPDPEATRPDAAPDNEQDETLAQAVAALKLRSIGPAVMGGRIADIAVHPQKPSTWYVAAGSGGVWKTTNAGTTWQPIFADQPSYSIGCITLDPTNPEIVWVGTGENVSGRHVGWGDGLYRSLNGGRTWERMGLAKSEHIAKIIIDPRVGNVLFVAAEGPLWSSGGERGLYRTTDGGKSWERVLEIDADTGVTDVLFDPSNPDTIYAAAYQRRRHTWSMLAGGSGSGIYKSIDGGTTWRKLGEGLPEGDMGKIGLATSAANPALLYATIEAAEKEKGFYRSQDRGESWEKRSTYLSGGTGPHYYQKLIASQQNADLIYQMDVFVHVTRDGGAKFDNLETGREKHSDNHALWIDPDDGQHLLVGTDGGLYESFDEGKSWRHFPNLPLTQFYRLDVDNSQPFYNILGGAQDLGTLFGPSRTTNVEGVRNQDWSVPLGADGYHVAFDPTDPNTFYLEYQVGNLFRYDRRSNELIDIQPQPAPDDPPERWNWDAPILISPHAATRIYCASQRLWRSDDRGNSWRPISGDLTQNVNRYQQQMLGRTWSVDALYDVRAMSNYSTITTLSESPLVEGLLYVGSDDGLIWVSEDGGETWRRAAPLPKVPEWSFIQHIEADQHDADTLFALADAHKLGDFRPYLFESNDRGRSWRSIAGDLPAETIVWAIQQDHVAPNLLFLATEFALYVSINRGTNWVKLSGDVPTIAFRDLKIQRRENDLVGASFGRGFYILDDYTPLREIAANDPEEKLLDKDTHLFPVCDAWWYLPNIPMQARGQPSQGSSAFKAPNPPFGATFTYHLKEEILGTKEARQRAEKELRKEGEDVPFPGWDRLRDEADELPPQLLLIVRDAAGEVVRRLEGPKEAGLHRLAWDLRLPAPEPIDLTTPDFVFPWATPPQGPLVLPGHYTVELVLQSSAGTQPLSPRQPFEVKPLPGEEARADFAEANAFQTATNEMVRQLAGAGAEIDRTRERLRHLQAALTETPRADNALKMRLTELNSRLTEIERRLRSDAVRAKLSEPSTPSVAERLGRIRRGHGSTRQRPTATQRQNLEIASDEFAIEREKLITLIETDLAELEAELAAVGAPWTPGRRL